MQQPSSSESEANAPVSQRFPPFTPSTPQQQLQQHVQQRSLVLPGMGIQRQLPNSSLYPPALLAQMFQPYFNGVFPPPEFAFHFLNQPTTSSSAQPKPLEPSAPFSKRMATMQHTSEDRDSGNESLSYAGSPPLSGTSSNESSRSNSFSVSALLKTELVAKARTALSSVDEGKPQPMQGAGPVQDQQVQIHTPTPVKPQPHHHHQAIPPHLQHHLQMQGFQFPHSSAPGPPLQQLSNFCFPPGASGPLTPQRPPQPPQQLQHGNYQDQFRLQSFFTMGMPPVNDVPNQRDVCVVCHDNASGYHYGVMSCEGCKGFFRRTVQKNMDYVCHKEKNCPVDRVSRNRCQACRFQKCIDKGMSKESVRQDRTRKRKTRDDDKDFELDETRTLMRIVEEVTQAYQETFPDGVTVQSVEDMTQRVGRFVSKISLFKEYSEDTLAAKVREGTGGCMLLRRAFAGDDSSAAADGQTTLVERLRSGLGHVDLDELALLSAVHVAQPGGVHGNDSVTLKLTECLQAQVRLNNPDKENASKFTRMLFKLPLLDTPNS